MKDPIRLRDAKSPHARAARDLLRSAVGGRASGSGFSVRGLAGPSLEQRDAMWASLAATIGPLPPSPSGGAGDGAPGPDGATGADPASALSGGDGLVAGASTGTAQAASVAKVAVATSAAKVAATTAAAAPAGKAALSLGAAKLWIVLGIGAAGSVGTAAYVTAPAPETRQVVVTPSDRAPRGPAAPADAKADTKPGTLPHVASEAAAAPAASAPAEATEPTLGLDAAKPATAPAAAPALDQAKARETADASKTSAPARVTPVAAASPPSPVAEVALTPAERASRLRDEAKATAEARTALRSGDAGGALRLLADATRSFGGGAMGQEREALTIEALARSGAREAASVRAEAFLARFPNSTYAAAVRPFATGSISK
jgi:hypothetical protein